MPEGANVIDSITGKDYGVAPRTVYYDTADARPDAEGCFYLNGFEARWVSGATEQTELVRVCGSTTGAYQIAVSRPASYPGLEQDMEWALQIQQTQAQARADRVARIAIHNEIYLRTPNPALPFPPGNGTIDAL